MTMSWLHASVWTLVLLIASIALFLTVGVATALLVCLFAYMGTKTGIAWLTLRRGGWRRPPGAFIVAYSLTWSAYVAYIVQYLYWGQTISDQWLAVFYALMFTSAAMSVATFPWRNEETTELRQARREAKQNQRGQRQDRRGALQDMRERRIDTQADRIGAREDAQQVRDDEREGQP